MNRRTKDLASWVGERLGGEVVLTALPAEASTRRFHRVRTSDGRTWIAMDAPPTSENNAQFIALAKAFRHAGVPVPEVHAADQDAGFLLVEDLGDDLFGTAYERGETDRCLDLAIATLIDVQRMRLDIVPPYTLERFETEIGIFRDWVLDALVAMPQGPLDALTPILLDATQRQPQVTVHRDYHSRNLLLRADGGIGVIDFQDALVGPVTYDLASLLYDCYVELPQATIDRHVDAYRTAAARAGLPTIDDPADFRRALELVAIQRSLKAVGIFVRLELERGQSSHLADVGPVLRRVAAVAARHDDLVDASTWIERSVLPAVQRAIEELL